MAALRFPARQADPYFPPPGIPVPTHIPAGKGMATRAISQLGPGGAQFLNSMNFLGCNLHPSLMQQLWDPMQEFAQQIRLQGGSAPSGAAASTATSASGVRGELAHAQAELRGAEAAEAHVTGAEQAARQAADA
eukprot:9502411-Pyramimonas_sp.AAC.1